MIKKMEKKINQENNLSGKEIAKILKKEYPSTPYNQYNNRPVIFTQSKDKIATVSIRRGNKNQIEKLIQFSLPFINQVNFRLDKHLFIFEKEISEVEYKKWLEETINKVAQ